LDRPVTAGAPAGGKEITSDGEGSRRGDALPPATQGAGESCGQGHL
jgi:hypothetical protein